MMAMKFLFRKSLFNKNSKFFSTTNANAENLIGKIEPIAFNPIKKSFFERIKPFKFRHIKVLLTNLKSTIKYIKFRSTV
jgi:hypothetical protein